jgi:hypothetical protein
MLGVGTPRVRMVAAQVTQTTQSPTQNRPFQPEEDTGSALDAATKAHMEDQRVKLQADDRQKHLLADTARLVELSNQLKDEVGKSTKYEVSVTAMRKAEEIEKLAHSVRERIRN